MDLDGLLVKKVAEVNNSAIGRFLSSLTRMVGGTSFLACLNVLCTSILGFMMTYPLYVIGGFWMALPTGLLTLVLVTILLANILNSKLGGLISGSTLRNLLVFAIILSLPFGLLSLPLLQSTLPAQDSDTNDA